MDRITKNDFVIAYTNFYGSTKKHALALWQEMKRQNNFDYAAAVIDCYNQSCRKAFYND